MHHFGLSPALPMAIASIALRAGRSADDPRRLSSAGWAALALAAFTLMATFVANRFWAGAGADRFMAANGFFEHLGLVGGFLLVAWMDWQERREAA